MWHGIRNALFISLILLFTGPGLAPATAQTAPTAPPGGDWRARLAEAIQRAAARNPEVQAAAARAVAARHRAAHATALPDPEIEIGFKDVPVRDLSLARDTFTMEMVTGRQRLPGRGKRAAIEATAQAEAEGLEAGRERAAIDLAADVADAFFRLAEADRSLSLLESARRRLEDATAAVTERYRVGKGGQSDVLQANLETTSLDERLATLRAERRTQAARFNTLQGLPALAPVAPWGALDPGGEAVPPEEELVRQALARSPAVHAARAEVRRAEQALALAVLDGRPDWMLMGYYGRRERFDDFVGVSAAIDLPWAHRRRLEELRAEKEADLAAARAGVEAATNQLQEEMEAAYAELDKNREQARLYRDSILPQAEMTYQSAREAYEVGKVDFLTLARAASDFDLYAREAAARSAGIGRAIAALQRASGLPLLENLTASGGSHVEK